ncbi:thiamine diphosphokinase, partial [Staphylococcus pasteuri]
INRDSNYPYISFIPLNDKAILTLQGFKYNLNQEHLNLGSTLTISNEVMDNEAIIRVEQGSILKIRSHD